MCYLAYHAVFKNAASIVKVKLQDHHGILRYSKSAFHLLFDYISALLSWPFPSF